MPDAPDFSDLGFDPTQAQQPTATQASTAPAQQASAPAAPAAGAPDFSDLGSHPVTGPSGSMIADIPTRLASAGTDLIANLAATPRALTGAADWLGSKVGLNLGLDQAAASLAAPNGNPWLPNAAQAKEEAYKATGATEYVPSTMGGRMAQAALSNAPLGALGGLGAVLPTMAGAATSEAAGELVPEHPIFARLLGYAFGSHSASMAANAVAKTAGMATGLAPTSPLYQAYQRQGVPTTLAGDVTQDPGLQLAQSMATKMPGGSDVMRNAGEDAINAWQQAAEKNAAALGPSASMVDAGVGLQSAANQWLQQFKQESANKWNAFRTAVPGDTPIPVTNFQQALQDVNQNFGGADNLQKTLQAALPSQLQDALKGDLSAQGMGPSNTLPWQAIQATRTRLGEMLESGQPIADTATSSIKRLYGGLSADMQAGANGVSPQAAQAFNDANAYTAAGHTLLDDHLNPILKATNPEQAAQFALAQVKQGGSRLGAIDQAMPGQAANLGATVLRQTAENGPGALPTKLKNISPEAQQLLFSAPPNPLASAAVDPSQGVADLNDISQAMRRTVQTTGNNSNTAAHSASGLGRVMTAIEMGRMGREVGGTPGAIAGGAAGFFAPNVIGRGAAMLGANPLLARIGATQFAPFSAPSMYSPNALAVASQPDRRNLLGSAAFPNPLLSGPGGAGSAATVARP